MVYCETKYTPKQVQGFTLMIAPDIDHILIEKITEDLKILSNRVPKSAWEQLKKTKIFMNKSVRFGKTEEEADSRGGACFHPAKGWLVENGNQEQKVESVEFYAMVPPRGEYLKRRFHFGHCQEPSPWCIIHELGHAYHWYLTWFKESEIDEVYRHASDKGIYESVPHVQGGNLKAYAMTNATEYFASLTAAYFAYNDYFPFTRDDLKKHDHKGYELIKKFWEMSDNEIQAMSNSKF